jgi:hypothetical protein
MSRPRNNGLRLKRLAVFPISGNKEPATRGAPPAFDGTIASACELVGISLEKMIEMLRWARESDPRVAQFLDAWDTLDPSEQVRGTVEAVRQRVGLKLLELLGIVVEVALRLAMYEVQIMVAASHPLVVEKTIDIALDRREETRDRLAAQTIIHKAVGLLPTPKGSQTIISIMENAQATAQARVVSAPSPEETIRRATNRFNEALGLPRTPPPALSERAIGRALSILIPENGDAMRAEIPEEEESDGE